MREYVTLNTEKILGYYNNITLRTSQTNLFIWLNLMEDALSNSGSLLSLSLVRCLDMCCAVDRGHHP